MSTYNFLAGSSIDNYTSFLFDALQSGHSYMSFGRGTPEMQWGINANIFIEHAASGAWYMNVANPANGDTYQSEKFFSLRSMKTIANANDTNRQITIGRVANDDVNFENVQMLSDNDIGAITLSFIGEHWAVVEGLSRYYYNIMSLSGSASYYIFVKNSLLADKDKVKAKILNKSFINVPYYTTNCRLWMKPASGADYELVKSNLQRTINILGESFVTGLTAPEVITSNSSDFVFSDAISGAQHKITLMGASFVLKDDSGNILIDNMTFVDPQISNPVGIYTEINSYGNQQKYVTFKYPYVGNEVQYIKFIIGNKQADELAIWNEVLPYNTAVPVSDANPPGLDISYLKNPLVNRSIFDVGGITKIDPAEISFVKEIFNVATSADYVAQGFTIETLELNGPFTEHIGIIKNNTASASTRLELNDFHTFIVGDHFTDPSVSGIQYQVMAVDYAFGASYIDINPPLITPLQKNFIIYSSPSEISAKVVLAKTQDKDKALKAGFFSVLVDKAVPLVGTASPTEQIYRQLGIVYRPKDQYGNLCEDAVYNCDYTDVLFNTTLFEYDLGLLLYMSNKIPIYRKWANIDENFKIIL